MVELSEPNPEVEVTEAEYKRLLGFPAGHELEGRARELADQCRVWYREHGRPWVWARETGAFDLEPQALKVNGIEFASERLHRQLSQAGAHQGVVALVSAGKECEERASELWQEQKPDEYFFMEVFGSAVVERLVTTTGARICAWAETNGWAVLPHYSPGYPGWEVSDQNKLFNLLRAEPEPGPNFPRDIRVHDSGMLEPKKSLLALFGITRHRERVRAEARLVPCENCSFSPCRYRRAPYREAWPQVEEVRRLQPRAGAGEVETTSGADGLERNARYSTNPRALKKWSQERLRLTFREDRSVDAHFRYDGTTCSNLGQPLEFEYRLRLGSAEEGYRILSADCAPAPGDTGHTQMCAYLNNAEELMKTISREKPLLGRPLNDVLSWERQARPSGCYCDLESRTHKWGLVLEVLHYTLAQPGNATTGGHHASVASGQPTSTGPQTTERT